MLWYDYKMQTSFRQVMFCEKLKTCIVIIIDFSVDPSFKMEHWGVTKDFCVR